MKRRPHSAATLCSAGYLLLGALALLLAAGCSSQALGAAYVQANRGQLARPASTTPRPRQFVVEPGASARTIAQDLAAAGLIRDDRLFEAYVRAYGLSSKLQAGKYSLSPHMTIPEIAQALQHGQADSITVTIPEGWRFEQVGDYLGGGAGGDGPAGTNGAAILDGVAYRQLAASGDPGGLAPEQPVRGLSSEDYAFLAVRPAGASLEGYLFPDTYELPAQDPTPADLVRRQLDNFAAQVLPLYEKAFAGGTTHLGLHDAITLASIVEREAVAADEGPMIARVYLNRLAQKMPLQADPTVQYAMGYQAETGQWWKTPVYLEEYGAVESPYNTYLHPGLPPGPICSPGLSSIRAALNPAEHDYLYFVATPGTGRHVFARTFEEHEANVRRYLGQ